MCGIAGVEVMDHYLFSSLPQSVCHRIAQTVVIFGRHFQFVDHQFYRVVLIAVEFHAISYFPQLSVDPDVEITFFLQLLEKVFVVAFAVVHQRREYIDFLPFIFFENHRHDFLLVVFLHRFTRQIALCQSYPGEKQTQVVIDLRGGAYGASGVAVDGFLFDGYYRRKTGNFINVGAFKRAEHIARI